MIENSLTELRFRFIQISEKTAQKATAAPDANVEGSAPAS
jgi:hypothetical protein